MLADWETHAGAEAKRGSNRSVNDTVSAQDPWCCVRQSPCHGWWFSPFLILLLSSPSPTQPNATVTRSLCDIVLKFICVYIFTLQCFIHNLGFSVLLDWIFFLQFCYLKRGLSYIHCHVVQPNKTCILFLARKYFYGRKKNKKLNFTGKNKILCVRKFHHNSPPVLTSLVIIFSCQLFNLFYLKKKLFNIILLKNMIYSFESIVLSFIFGASSCNPKIF